MCVVLLYGCARSSVKENFCAHGEGNIAATAESENGRAGARFVDRRANHFRRREGGNDFRWTTSGWPITIETPRGEPPAHLRAGFVAS
jgi:hypothetical protein